MKKIICAVLAFVMFALCFASCTKNAAPNASEAEHSDAVSGTDNSETDNSVAPESTEEASAADPWRNADGDYVSPNEKLNVVEFFGDEKFLEFHVLVKGDDHGTYQSDDFTTGSELYGDTLDTAVSQRNTYILDNYGVTIVPHKEKNINVLVREEIASGGNYDLVMPNIPFLATIAGEGALYDLNTLGELLHIDAPWYDQNANETFSMNHQLFYTTGDITILNKVCTIGVVFGEELLAKNTDLEDPYQLVREHRWTYDKMKEMSRLVTADTDGVSGMTCDDTSLLTATSSICTAVSG